MTLDLYSVAKDTHNFMSHISSESRLLIIVIGMLTFDYYIYVP